MKIKTQEISLPLLKEKKVQLFIKRIDQIHEYISGNKWYKLKYNFIEAEEKGFASILTFGGAFSNHIVATANMAKLKGFSSVGIIRGENHLPLNSSLSFAVEQGMKIYSVSRRNYRLKDTVGFLNKLEEKFGNFYLIPEGGTNKLAIKGAEEILDLNDTQDYICCAVGTGGTIAGVINSSNESQKVIGFPVIKGFSKLEKDILSWVNKKNYYFLNDYFCGGYARLNDVLINVINNFYKTQKIPLDVVYTGKMILGILDLIAKDHFPKGSSILAIHTGGIQGNKGMNNRFGLHLPVA
tara:strand:- start:39846 stop:40733 length:888 start_codon:yes stop_codon:yes gene_type:complete